MQRMTLPPSCKNGTFCIPRNNLGSLFPRIIPMSLTAGVMTHWKQDLLQATARMLTIGTTLSVGWALWISASLMNLGFKRAPRTMMDRQSWLVDPTLPSRLSLTILFLCPMVVDSSHHQIGVRTLCSGMPPTMRQFVVIVMVFSPSIVEPGCCLMEEEDIDNHETSGFKLSCSFIW